MQSITTTSPENRQIGENSTLAMTMWGLGNLRTVSYRTLVRSSPTRLSARAPIDGRCRQPLESVLLDFLLAEFGPLLQRVQALRNQPTRTPNEEAEMDFLLQAFSGGFCIGGYLMNDRHPAAFQILYNPMLSGQGLSTPSLWEALASGVARPHKSAALRPRRVALSTILQSGKWTGSNRRPIQPGPTLLPWPAVGPADS